MNNSLSTIKCALQIALLGAITSDLRGINIFTNDQQLLIKFYYQNPPSNKEKDLVEQVGTKVHASLVDYKVDTIIEVLPISKTMPVEGIRVFHRKE